MKVTHAKVRRIFKKWMTRLNADHRIDFKIHVYKTVDECPPEYRYAVAAIAVDLAYFQGELMVNAWRVDSEKELDYALCHESCHVVCWQLGELAKAGLGDHQEKNFVDILESTIEQLTAGLTRR